MYTYGYVSNIRLYEDVCHEVVHTLGMATDDTQDVILIPDHLVVEVGMIHAVCLVTPESL